VALRRRGVLKWAERAWGWLQVRPARSVSTKASLNEGAAVLAPFVGWYYVAGASLVFALTLAIAVVVIACPDALEQASKIQAVIFDQTGTLTIGEPPVVARCRPHGPGPGAPARSPPRSKPARPAAPSGGVPGVAMRSFDHLLSAMSPYVGTCSAELQCWRFTACPPAPPLPAGHRPRWCRAQVGRRGALALELEAPV
jgi:hypothetical protein